MVVVSRTFNEDYTNKKLTNVTSKIEINLIIEDIFFVLAIKLLLRLRIIRLMIDQEREH